jgi:glucuronoarabinoxylan endo-1,4-beta-xylanase
MTTGWATRQSFSMKHHHRALPIATFASLLGLSHQTSAATAAVTLGSQKQFIRAIGGMSHAAWAGDLTVAERSLAFGNGDGQLGFSALRIPVTDGSPDSANVATAKAAIAAGAIVFASPWNAAGTMSSSQFASYATHLNDFVAYMKNQGVDLYAISVQNEPDYGMQSGWRAWSASLCHDFVLNYGSMITTKLISCESFNYDKSYYDPVLNDSGALANVAVLGTHLYGTAVSNYAYPLFDQKGAGKERWMTEHYTDSTTDANSWPNALGVATEMHHAFVDGQFNLYTWWYIVRSYGPISSNGMVSKRGWCMAQFSKFIRPGFYRVDGTATPTSGVYLSAYKGTSDVVIVIVNTNNSAEPLTISIDGSSIASYDRFTTSSSKSLANDGTVDVSNGSVTLSLDAQSVTTLHGTQISGGSGGTSGSGGSNGAGGGTSSGGFGGSAGVGGVLGSGASTASGGATSSGASAATGGVLGSGASTATGNVTGSGASAPTGGAMGSGGPEGLGGSFGSGGAMGFGGSIGSGSSPTGAASGGVPTNSGAPSIGGSDTPAATSPDGGCSCRVRGGRLPSAGISLLSLLSALALASRRSRERRNPS